MPAFFDTNVLIYSVDLGETGKQELVADLVEEHLVWANGPISVQVLCEFYSASREIDNPLSDEQAREIVRRFATFRVLPEDAETVLRAIRRHQESPSLAGTP